MVNLKQEPFGEVKGQPVSKFTWTTDTGFSVSAITYGAIITNILVKDEHGELADVVLGFDDLQSYIKPNVYSLGAAVGRCAYSIADGKFSIDGTTYNLAKNAGGGSFHIHGGRVGFSKVVWTPTVHGTCVNMSYLSRDGEEGYPGDLVTTITYTVTEDGTLEIDYIATTTKTTVINLTNHSYFNLAGHAAGSQELYEHFFVINADKIIETISREYALKLIPTGRLVDVHGTPYDLRSARKLGDVINTGSDLFDHYFCVRPNYEKDLSFIASAQHPGSGRYMKAYSNQPGLQFVTSNYLPASGPGLLGKSGVGYHRHAAFCFNIQTYLDAVHHENFPTSILRPGQVYRHKTKYVFGAEKSVPCVVPE